MANRLAKPLVGGAPTLLTALLAVLCHAAAQAALPPAEAKESIQKSTPKSTKNSVATVSDEFPSWTMPPIRLGGNLSYNMRRDSSEDQNNQQTGLSTTLMAATNTYIWRPWFALVNGRLGFTSSTDTNGSNETSSSNKNVQVSGSGQLSVLSQSKYPFEAHFERTNSSISSDIAVANGYAGQRVGFTQRYLKDSGEAMLGWDRNTQTSSDSGRDVQDSLQLRLSHRLEKHNMQLTGNRETNVRELTGDSAKQSNVTLQHSYAPTPYISVENLVNVSQSDYSLQQNTIATQLLQLSSNAFWRPEEQPLTVTGGFRLFSLGSETTGLVANPNATNMGIKNSSANLGVNYEFNPFVRMSASANVNVAETNGVQTIATNTNQALTASYQADPIDLGNYKYSPGTSATLSNQTGHQDAGLQLVLQLTHNLNRSMKLESGSTVTIDANQSLSALSGNTATSSDTATKQLTHNASLAWSLPQQVGTAMARFSFSDARALDGNEEFFQLINLQASSNLPTSSYSSWNGNLTVQATRQGGGVKIANRNTSNDFVTTSGGSISYQNQRLFGVRRLQFVTDLRLNSLALLPLLGSSGDQENSAWNNNLIYTIGRTQLRFNFLVASSSSKKNSTDPLSKVENSETVKRINRSIMFTVVRSFGDL